MDRNSRGKKGNARTTMVEDGDGNLYDVGPNQDKRGFRTDADELREDMYAAAPGEAAAAPAPTPEEPPEPPRRNSSAGSTQPIGFDHDYEYGGTQGAVATYDLATTTGAKARADRELICETVNLPLAFDKLHQQEDSVKKPEKLYTDYLARMRSVDINRALPRFKEQLNTALMSTTMQNGMTGEMLQEFVGYLRAVGLEVTESSLPKSLNPVSLPSIGTMDMPADEMYVEPTELTTFAMLKKDNGKPYKPSKGYASWLDNPGMLKFEKYDRAKHAGKLGSKTMDFDGKPTPDNELMPTYVATLVSRNAEDPVREMAAAAAKGDPKEIHAVIAKAAASAKKKKSGKGKKAGKGSGVTMMMNPAYELNPGAAGIGAAIEADEGEVLPDDGGYLGLGTEADSNSDNDSVASGGFGWPDGADDDVDTSIKGQAKKAGSVKSEAGSFGFGAEAPVKGPVYETVRFGKNDMRLTHIKPVSGEFTEIRTEKRTLYLVSANGLYQALQSQPEYGYVDNVGVGGAPVGETQYLYKVAFTRKSGALEFDMIQNVLRRMAADDQPSQKKKAGSGCCYKNRWPIGIGVGVGTVALIAAIAALSSSGGGGGGEPVAPPTFDPLGSTGNGSSAPSFAPSQAPIAAPSSFQPSLSPTFTRAPSGSPTFTMGPTGIPTVTFGPTGSPTFTWAPTLSPTFTFGPTNSPTFSIPTSPAPTSGAPTAAPSRVPTALPTQLPTAQPTAFSAGSVTITGTSSVAGPVHNWIPFAIAMTADVSGQSVNGFRLTGLGSGVTAEYRTSSSAAWQSVSVSGGQADIPSGFGEFRLRFTAEGSRSFNLTPRVTNGQSTAYTSSSVGLTADVRCVREDNCQRFNGRCAATIIAHRICECDKADSDTPWRQRPSIQASQCSVTINSCRPADYTALQPCMWGIGPVARRRDRRENAETARLGMFNVTVGDPTRERIKAKASQLKEQAERKRAKARQAMFQRKQAEAKSRGKHGKAANGGYTPRGKAAGRGGYQGR